MFSGAAIASGKSAGFTERASLMPRNKVKATPSIAAVEAEDIQPTTEDVASVLKLTTSKGQSACTPKKKQEEKGPRRKPAGT